MQNTLKRAIYYIDEQELNEIKEWVLIDNDNYGICSTTNKVTSRLSTNKWVNKLNLDSKTVMDLDMPNNYHHAVNGLNALEFAIYTIVRHITIDTLGINE